MSSARLTVGFIVSIVAALSVAKVAHATQCPGSLNPPAAVGSPYQLPDAVLNTPYSFTITQTGATTPYWQILSGNPPGLTAHGGFAPSLVIDGTPTQTNPADSWSIALYDQSVPNCSANVGVYNLRVLAAPPDAGSDASTGDDASTAADASTGDDASTAGDASAPNDAGETADAADCAPEGASCRSAGDCCFLEPSGAACVGGVCRSYAPEPSCTKINEKGCHGPNALPCCALALSTPICDESATDNSGICCVQSGALAATVDQCCSNHGTPALSGVRCDARNPQDEQSLCSIGASANGVTSLLFGLCAVAALRLRRRRGD